MSSFSVFSLIASYVSLPRRSPFSRPFDSLTVSPKDKDIQRPEDSMLTTTLPSTFPLQLINTASIAASEMQMDESATAILMETLPPLFTTTTCRYNPFSTDVPILPSLPPSPPSPPDGNVTKRKMSPGDNGSGDQAKRIKVMDKIETCADKEAQGAEEDDEENDDEDEVLESGVVARGRVIPVSASSSCVRTTSTASNTIAKISAATATAGSNSSNTTSSTSISTVTSSINTANTIATSSTSTISTSNTNPITVAPSINTANTIATSSSSNTIAYIHAHRRKCNRFELLVDMLGQQQRTWLLVKEITDPRDLHLVELYKDAKGVDFVIHGKKKAEKGKGKA
ncbi:hypothetical protein BGX29_001551 [Mortierella sp. GBA35]|nr:hypothetical protein BGX29_001551 [Mortierella sp. GBA35]